MAMMLVDAVRATTEIKPGTLMIHNDPYPPMVVVVTELTTDGLGFFGASLEDGVYLEWALDQFTIFSGKLTLEQ